MFEALEHVKARAGGSQQNDVSWFGGLERATHCIAHVTGVLVRDERTELLRNCRRVFANQYQLPNLLRNK